MSSANEVLQITPVECAGPNLNPGSPNANFIASKMNKEQTQKKKELGHLYHQNGRKMVATDW